MILVQGRAVHARAIRHESGFRICLLPEVEKGTLLKLVDEVRLREGRSPNKAVTGPRTPKKQNDEDEAASANTSLPFDDFKLRFEHFLRV
jgi:hypothetical protein